MGLAFGLGSGGLGLDPHRSHCIIGVLLIDIEVASQVAEVLVFGDLLEGAQADALVEMHHRQHRSAEGMGADALEAEVIAGAAQGLIGGLGCDVVALDATGKEIAFGRQLGGGENLGQGWGDDHAAAGFGLGVGGAVEDPIVHQVIGAQLEHLTDAGGGVVADLENQAMGLVQLRKKRLKVFFLEH
jgi:hypothetical protein